MSGVVVVDTNLLLPLIVGLAGRQSIGMHTRLQDYSLEDFDRLTEAVGRFWNRQNDLVAEN